jgi:enolase
MPSISSVKAYTILDSRGLPTVQCEVVIIQGGIQYKAVASVPSGASTGTHEALELRDGEKAFGGKGVTKAVNNIKNIIAPAILNKEFNDAKVLDQAILALDPSQNKTEMVLSYINTFQTCISHKTATN